MQRAVRRERGTRWERATTRERATRRETATRRERELEWRGLLDVRWGLDGIDKTCDG